MKKFVEWLTKGLTPISNKVGKNPYIMAIQNTIMKALPMIFVGSIITILDIIEIYATWLPDFSPISSFTFGLFALFVAVQLPVEIMEQKKLEKFKVVSGLTSLGLTMMLIYPTITDDGAVFVFDRFGSQGMVVALVAGFFTSFVMIMFSKFSFFKEDSVMPSFVIRWFDSILPILTVMLVGWIFIYGLNIDIFNVIVSIFEPVVGIAQTLPGFLFLTFIYVFLYSLGISCWILAPVTVPIMLAAIAENAAAVADGLSATNIYTYEVIQVGWITIGGWGATLPLCILMCFSASKRLKAIGRACIGPSIVNVNEPLVFGAPIAWNPILMIPMWVGTVLISLTTYITLSAGWVDIPSQVFQMWYLPFGISTFLTNNDPRGLILLAVNIVIMFVVWYPFFKVYERQEVQKEQQEQVEEAAA